MSLSVPEVRGLLGTWYSMTQTRVSFVSDGPLNCGEHAALRVFRNSPCGHAVDTLSKGMDKRRGVDQRCGGMQQLPSGAMSGDVRMPALTPFHPPLQDTQTAGQAPLPVPQNRQRRNGGPQPGSVQSVVASIGSVCPADSCRARPLEGAAGTVKSTVYQPRGVPVLHVTVHVSAREEVVF